MAATADQLIVRQEEGLLCYPVAASTTLYQGTMAFQTAAGYADDDTGAGQNGFAGIVRNKVDNSAGSAGDKKAELYKVGIFELQGSGFAQTDVGRPVFATDNFTVTTTRTANSVHVGEVVEYVSSTKVMVRIRTKQEPESAIADPSGGATVDSQSRTAIGSIIDVLEMHGLIDAT